MYPPQSQSLLHLPSIHHATSPAYVLPLHTPSRRYDASTVTQKLDRLGVLKVVTGILAPTPPHWTGIETHVSLILAMLCVHLVGFDGTVSFIILFIFHLLYHQNAWSRLCYLIIYTPTFYTFLLSFNFHVTIFLGLSFPGRRGHRHIRGGHME